MLSLTYVYMYNVPSPGQNICFMCLVQYFSLHVPNQGPGSVACPRRMQAVRRLTIESGTFFRGKISLFGFFKKSKLSVTCERMGTK